MSEEKKTKAGVWALTAKLGTKGLSIFAKLFKLTKVGFAVASFAGYALLFSWKFALLLMIAVGFHESGHVWAMKRMGIKTKGFYFLPFIGGAAIAEESYKTYGENAYIAIMGPIWGLAMAFGAACLYWFTGNPLWAAAGAWMSTLNLFNLLPVNPLDGGQLMRSICFSINKTLGIVFLGFSLLAGGLIMWKFHIYLFAILLAVGALELALELNARKKLHYYQQGWIEASDLPSSMREITYTDNVRTIKVKHYPTDMNVIQLSLAFLSYVGTAACLVALLHALKGVSGADLAANFFE
jgi:Zn-dependent protease